MAEETQDGQKTLVAFIVGLLIGGMLVWAFSGPTATAPVAEVENEATEMEDGAEEGEVSDEEEGEETAEEAVETPELTVGEGEVVVSDQPASASIALESATYPISEGWIGVREYDNDNLGFILGVVRFSESQGLVPAEITLQRSTTPGRNYAIVIFSENGDRGFNLATDVQIDQVFGTFRAE
tara:strand:+ start:942 stop:1487 length:546 start_codon:yes stop_codon:yes gene_type:complete